MFSRQRVHTLFDLTAPSPSPAPFKPLPRSTLRLAKMFSVKYYTEKLTDNSAVSESMEKKEEEIKNVNALCVKVCRVQKLRQSSSYHASYLGSFPLAASYNHTTTDISQCSHTSGESLTDSAKMSGGLAASYNHTTTDIS